MSVEQIVREHWKHFGRNYYTRYDYESVATDKADAVMAHLSAHIAAFAAAKTSNAAHGTNVECSEPVSCTAESF